MVIACVVALAFRLPGVFNGLPYVSNADEPVIYSIAHRMVANGTALPHSYTYPSLHFELNALVHAAVSTVGRWFGAWHSVNELGLLPPRPGAAVVLNSEPWAAARLITVAIAVIGVALVVALTTRLSGSRRWGLVAGLLAATSGIGVATGFVVAPDALAATTATAAIVAALRLHGRGAIVADRRWAILTGAMLGLAVGSKYNNGLLVLLVIAAVAMAPPERRPTLRHLAILVLAAGALFLVTTPGALFQPSEFLSALRGIGGHYSSGHPGYEGDSFSVNAHWLWSSDRLALVLAVAATSLRRTRAVALLAGWVVVYFTFVSLPTVHFPRNLSPVLGAVAVLGALGGQQLWHLLRASRSPTQRQLMIAVALVALVPAAWLHACDRLREFSYNLTDHQGDARRWLTTQLPAGSAVLTDNYTPWLDEQRYTLTISGLIAQASPSQAEAFADQYDAVVFTSDGSGRFTADRERYPAQSAIVDQMRSDACDLVRYEDTAGFWIEVYFQRCP